MAVDTQSTDALEVASSYENHILETLAASKGSSENSPLSITEHKLNGNNYLQWPQSVMMYICGKEKDEYMTGVIVPPRPKILGSKPGKYKTIW